LITKQMFCLVHWLVFGLKSMVGQPPKATTSHFNYCIAQHAEAVFGTYVHVLSFSITAARQSRTPTVFPACI